MRNRSDGPRGRGARLFIVGATLAAVLAAPVAGSAASLANSQFHIKAVNAEQKDDFWAIRPWFEGKTQPEVPTPTEDPAPPTAEPTAPVVTEPPVTVPTPTPTPTVTPKPTAPPVDPAIALRAQTVSMVIDTTLPGCVASPFNLEIYDNKVPVEAKINWGDDKTTVATGGVNNHSYAPGRYNLDVVGTLSGLVRTNATMPTSTTSPNPNNCIESVTHFGENTKIFTLNAMLKDAKNIKSVAAPPTTLVDATAMFYGATNFNGDVTNWKTGNITNFEAMFRNAAAFNQDLSGWDMSKAFDISWMFSGAKSFNGNVTNWNVSSVHNMNWLFQGAIVFNQDISKWVPKTAYQFIGVFDGAYAFNQNIAGWDRSTATNYAYMLRNAKAFNQDLSSWDLTAISNKSDFRTGSGLIRAYWPKGVY